MNKIVVNKSLFFTAFFVLLLAILLISLTSKAQENLYAQNFSVIISDETIKTPANDRFSQNSYNSDIIGKLKLTSKEKELLREIKQLSNEANIWTKEANNLRIEIQDLYKIIKLSERFDDIHSKAIRKAERYNDYEMSLRYDAEEFLEMSNSLLFNLYENHLPTYDQIISAGFKDFQSIIDLNDEAQALNKKAKKLKNKAYDEYNYKKGIEYLEKANLLENEALRKQELAFAMYFGMPITNLLADLEDNTIAERDEESCVEIQSKITEDIGVREDKPLLDFESNETINISEDKTIENTIIKSKKIVFKVQVGAFVKNIEKEKFNGLSPLSVDNTDQVDFTKFMVGEYYSYKAACQSKSIISNSTNFKDAFVVAYVDGKRVPVDVVLSEYR